LARYQSTDAISFSGEEQVSSCSLIWIEMDEEKKHVYVQVSVSPFLSIAFLQLASSSSIKYGFGIHIELLVFIQHIIFIACLSWPPVC
jgi:hypothetical protein